MKMKKVLAAVLAGTMVFAMTAPVFAENRVTKRMQSNVAWECWWNGENEDKTPGIDTDGDGVGDYVLTEEEYENKFFYFDDLEGDGEWSIPMQCVLTENGDDEMYTVTGDVYDDNDHWLSYGTHGDVWGSGKNSGQNTEVDPQLKAGDIVTFTINREGSEFTIKIAKNGTDFLRFKSSDSPLEGDKLHTRVGVQFGVWDIYPIIEGDAKAAIDTVDAGASDAATKTGTTGTTGTTGADEATAGTSGATAGSDSGSAGSSSSAGTSSSSATTPKTGDSTPLVAVLVAMAGCGAIVFASKKRFAK